MSKPTASLTRLTARHHPSSCILCTSSSSRRPIYRLPSPLRAQSRSISIHQAWRPSSALEEHVARAARPISLRQLTFFGRNLTLDRLLDSANYVRTELPTRLAHRIRDMQRLPYVVVTNEHISKVYETYYNAFEQLRKTPEIKTSEGNDAFCRMITNMLTANLTVIPDLAIGVLECRDLVPAAELDTFLSTMLKSVRLHISPRYTLLPPSIHLLT